MFYTTKLYRITALTHIHVGSGQQNYGIIDKLVQKDPVNALPMIHGSSLKGALREFFVQKEGKDSKIVVHVFGKENKGNTENKGNEDGDQNSAGHYRFFDARLLALPVRTDKLPYVLASAPAVLKDLSDMLKTMGLKLNGMVGDIAPALKPVASASHFLKELESDPILLEDLDKPAAYHASLPGEALAQLIAGQDVPNLALLPDNMLKDLCDDNHLPVIARNSLENGRSTNLWYEQIVPRQSVFYTLVMMPRDDQYASVFHETLTADEPVQIGANASIGYGFCKISEISTQNIKSS